jgi:hypothetical protein
MNTANGTTHTRVEERVGLRAFLILVALAATTAYGASFYVAIDGRPENDGSLAKPWPSVEYALSQVGGKHTIIVKPGIYRGPMQIAKQYAGTKERPTVIQSEVKWQAVIIGAEYHVISNDDGCDWLVIDGFEVMGGRYDGVKMNGDYNVVRNCWVHKIRRWESPCITRRAESSRTTSSSSTAVISSLTTAFTPMGMN